MRKEERINSIMQTIEKTRPLFKKLPLHIYGQIYKIENIKNGHIYIGKTIRHIADRYGGTHNNLIENWIEHTMLNNTNCKFIEEYFERPNKIKADNFILTPMIDVGYCKWHLDKLEVYWIEKCNSINNGYNTSQGSYKTDKGIEDFNKLLKMI